MGFLITCDLRLAALPTHPKDRGSRSYQGSGDLGLEAPECSFYQILRVMVNQRTAQIKGEEKKLCLPLLMGGTYASTGRGKIVGADFGDLLPQTVD